MRQLTKLLTLSCLLVSASLSAADYQFKKIDFPGAAATIAHGVNARGEIVGIYFDDDGTSHSFVLRNGVYKTLKMVPGASMMLAARGINAQGDIVGNFVDLNGSELGYLLRDGKYQKIDFPGSAGTLLSSINNSGDIVGFVFFEDGRFNNFIRKRNGKVYVVEEPPFGFMVVRSALDNGRVFVGSMELDGTFRGFIRTKPGEFEIIEYPGLPLPCSFVRFINRRGELLGNFGVADPGGDCGSAEGRGYLLRDGEFKVIHFPGSLHTQPFAINDDGMIVGRVDDEDGSTHGFKAVPTR